MSAVENSVIRIVPHDLGVASAKLPAVYESAKLALAECYRIDECAEWANKAEALASYARQAEDDELLKTATRVKARAIRRCGELLKAIEGAKNQYDAEKRACVGDDISRSQAARDAGLSNRQKVTVLRVASVPEQQFESAVESEKPPTVTALAKMGTKPQPKPLVDLEGRQPGEFALSTKGQGAIGRLVEVATQVEPAVVARGAYEHERKVLKKQVSRLIQWLQCLDKELT